MLLKNDPHEIPPAGELVWKYFWELDKGRSSGFDLNRLSWSDIAEWQRVTDQYMELWELQAIHIMDAYRINPDYDPTPPKPMSMIASLKAIQDANKVKK